MGLGKVIGLGIAFIVLLIPTIGVAINGVLEAIATAIQYGYVGLGLILYMVGYMIGVGFFVFITYLVGKVFIKALREYKASRVGKPLQ
jgi:hypothetical protein